MKRTLIPVLLLGCASTATRTPDPYTPERPSDADESGVSTSEATSKESLRDARRDTSAGAEKDAASPRALVKRMSVTSGTFTGNLKEEGQATTGLGGGRQPVRERRPFGWLGSGVESVSLRLEV